MARNDIDLMEYANDAAAQAAYVTNGSYAGAINLIPTMTSATAPSGVASATSELGAGYEAWRAMRGIAGDGWISSAGVMPGSQFLRYQLAAAKVVAKYSITSRNGANPGCPASWTFQGSNNGSSWTTLDTQTGQFAGSPQNQTNEYTIANTTAYSYYQLVITSTVAQNYCCVATFKLYEKMYDPQTYSEATIKAEGSYSLKGIALITTSLNKTLTKAVSPTVDLSNKEYIGIYMRASRTGANIKIGFHDSGGTTTEITPTIFTAVTWELKILDLSAVTNANKDVVDSIIITITNADADNTFYIDCVYSDTFPTFINYRPRKRTPGAVSV